MSARQLPQVDYLGLKAATRELVKLAGGTAQAARVSRVSQQEFSKYGAADDDHAERFMPIDIVADLEAEVGPVVSDHLARMTGHALVRLPLVGMPGGELDRLTGQAFTEIGEMFAKLGAIVADGKVQTLEADSFDAEADDAVAKILALKLRVRAEVKQ